MREQFKFLTLSFFLPTARRSSRTERLGAATAWLCVASESQRSVLAGRTEPRVLVENYAELLFL